MREIIMGVDPGTRILGWAIIGGKKPVLGTVQVEGPGDRPTRLLLLMHTLNDVVREHKPTRMAVEDQFIGKNPQAAMAIVRAETVVEIVAAANDLVISLVNHSTAKLFLTGKGNASKDLVRKAARNLLGWKKLPEENAADALAVAHYMQAELL